MANLLGRLGMAAGTSAVKHLENVAQQRALDYAHKQQLGTLNQFFPESVSGLILSLPEKDRWPAIQALAPEFANEQGGQNELGLESLVEQGQLGPQGPQPLDQLLGQAMGQQRQGQPSLMQSIQQPVAQQSPQAAPQQQAPQEINQKPESARAKFGKALSGQKKNEKQNAVAQKKIESAQELIQIANEMEKLHSTGKVLNGRWGTWQRKLGPLGIWEPNDETNTFDSLGSQAAILEASLIPGVTTNEKLKAAERTKPNITQTKNTQLARIKAMKKKAQDILNQYGSELPNESAQKEQPSAGALPSAAEAQGKTFKRGNKKVKSVQVDGQWTWRSL